MSRRADFAALAAVAGVAVITAIVVHRGPAWSFVGPDPAELLVELLAAVALTLAGLVVCRRSPDARSGALLLAAAAVWPVAEWNNPRAIGAVVFTAGLVLAEAFAVLVAHALLVHGDGKLHGRLERGAVIAAYGGLLLVAGLGAALATDPRAQGCAECPASLLAIADAPGAAAELQRWGMRLGSVALAAVAALLVVSLLRATPGRRRAIAPVVLPGVAFLALACARYGSAWHGDTATDRTLRVAAACALGAIAGGVAWQRLAARRMRHRLSRIAMQVSQAPRPGELRPLLADALDDPTLELLHATPDGWIDAGGESRSLPDRRALTRLVRDDTVVAVVVHRPGLFDDPRLVEELARAAALALEHERLQARLRAELERLREARRRAVRAADRERQQLERDLHDGAQQGLAALAMAISVEHAGDNGRRAEALERASADVRRALDDVRAIAHGLFPAVLADAGLPAALDVLTDWCPNLESAPIAPGRLEPATEATAYFIVAAAARATTVPVSAAVDRRDGRLIIDIETDDAPDLAELEDRVGAVDGHLRVTTGRDGRRRVRAELPCA